MRSLDRYAFRNLSDHLKTLKLGKRYNRYTSKLTLESIVPNACAGEANFIVSSSVRLDKASFLQDETLKRAYIRSIAVIGEAVKQLPDELRQKHRTIEGRAIAGMRDRLSYNYFLPVTYRQLTELLLA